MHRRTAIFIILVALFIHNKVEAQQVLLRNFTMNDYHGGTQNWDIDITSNNRLLFANNTGMKAFNSVEWETLPLGAYNEMRSVCYDNVEHMIWAGGSYEFGYFKHDDDSHSVRYHSISHYLPSHLQRFQEIWRIVRWGKHVVFQAPQHLFFFCPDNRQLTYIVTPFTIESCAVVGQRLIVASKQGVFSVKNGNLQPVEGTDVLKGMTVRGILKYQGDIIFATSTHGLYRYDGTTHKMELGINDFITGNQLFCATIHGDQLAIGTVRNGLVLTNLKTGTTQYVNMNTGLQNNTVLSVRFDQSENIWLGLDQGVAYVMPNYPFNYLLGNQSPIGTGYASAIHQGQLYLGTNQGLFNVPYPIVSSPYPPQPQLVDNMTGQMWCLTNIDGTLFCGSDAGAFVVNGNKTEHIIGPEGSWNFISLKHHPGLILGCDYRGLFILRKDSNGHYEMAGRVEGFNETSGLFMEDDDGSIWMSHWKRGIYHLGLSANGQRVTNSVLYNSKNGLLVDGDNLICRVNGQIYISSVDGFYRLNHSTGQLEHVDAMNNIFKTYGQALRIYETPSGDLWAYKPHFLAVARPQKDGTFTVDSLFYKGITHELQMSLGNPCYTDSSVLMNCQRGFLDVRFPSKLPVLPQYQVMIYEIQAYSGNDSTVIRSLTPTNNDRIFSFSHQLNSLRFAFTLPDFVAHNEITYSCLLEGYDDYWQDCKNNNTKEYTHLSKGKYLFRVKAQHLLNGQSYETSVSIEILPAWYETWWAYLIYLLIVVGIVWQLYVITRRHQANVVRRLQAQEAQKRERQKAQFEMEQREKEHELALLRTEQLEHDMKANASKLADSTMNLMRKNDMLLTLDEKMAELAASINRNDPKPNIARSIKGIRHNIQENIKEDENWERFEENFNLVYDGYMKKLTERFPDLKLNDRKLCAYLRMGLSSKEMASLLNTTTRSIETARYRLRKKLQMESGDNLTEFIQSL